MSMYLIDHKGDSIKAMYFSNSKETNSNNSADDKWLQEN
jgi:hypothetical protein